MKKLSLPLAVLSIFPFFFLVAIFLFRYHFFTWYEPLIQEDSVFEWLQFAGYFLTSALLFKHAKYLRKWPRELRWLLAVSGFFLLWVAAEEISWGQRIFNLQNPEYFAERNVQNELSIHNLDFIQPGLHGAYLIICLFLAIAQVLMVGLWKQTSSFKKTHRYLGYLKKLAPPWYLASYFVPVSVFYALFIFWRPFGAYMRNGVLLMVGRDQEVFETLLAWGIALSIILFSKQQQPQRR